MGEVLVERLAQGEPIHRAEEKRAPLDEQTLEDLDVKLSLLPFYDKHLSTSLGDQHLLWSLRNPLVDPAAILRRQEAARTFREQPELTAKAQSWLRALQKAQGGIPVISSHRVNPLPMDLKSLFEDNQKKASGSGFEFYFVSLLLHGTTAGAYAWLDGRPHAFVFMAPALLMSPMSMQQRSHLEPYRVLAGAAKDLAEELLESPSEHLRDIGYWLHAAVDSEHELAFGRDAAKLRSLLPKTHPLARVFDILLASNYWLPSNMKALRRNALKFAILASAIADLDLMIANSKLLDIPGAIFPTPLDPSLPTTYRIVEGHHPYFAIQGESSVPNSATLSPGQGQDQLIFLTGPNARGKSTLIRTLGLNLLLAQTGAPVFAKSMEFTPMMMLTNIRTSDSIADKESSYQAECARMARLMETGRSWKHAFYLVDEMFIGTSPKEQFAQEWAVIERMQRDGHLAIVASHKRGLSDLEGIIPGFRNYHMSDSDEPGRKYTIELGVSQRYNAFDVAEEKGMPKDVVDRAREIHAQDLVSKLILSRGKDAPKREQ